MNQLATSLSPLVHKRLLLKRSKVCRRAYTDTSIKSYVFNSKDGDWFSSSSKQITQQNKKVDEASTEAKAKARQEYIERCAFEISAC